MEQRRTRILICAGEETAKWTRETLDELFEPAERDAIEVAWCPADEVPEEARRSDVLVPLVYHFTRERLASWPRVKLCIQYGVGVETIDQSACDDLGIYVSNIPSSGTHNAIGVAELAVYLTIAALRRHDEMEQAIQSRRVNTPIGDTLAGKRVLLVGFGGIGVELARRLRLWDCSVSALRAREWVEGRDGEAVDEAAQHLHAKGTWARDRFEFAKHADVVIVSAMANATTAGMIDAEFLAACPDGVVLVNVARAILVDRPAVEAALASGKLGFLATDVFWNEPLDPADELARHPRVYVTPHVGGHSRSSYRDLTQILLKAALAIHNKHAPDVVLNSPKNPKVANGRDRDDSNA